MLWEYCCNAVSSVYRLYVRAMPQYHPLQRLDFSAERGLVLEEVVAEFCYLTARQLQLRIAGRRKKTQTHQGYILYLMTTEVTVLRRYVRKYLTVHSYFILEWKIMYPVVPDFHLHQSIELWPQERRLNMDDCFLTGPPCITGYRDRGKQKHVSK